MSFQLAGLCFTNAAGVAVHHDLRLVALSYLVAAGGSFAALEMIERWRHARGTQARSWQIASAVTLGGSIWCMHFVAMLALEMSLPTTYAPGPTLLSLLIAIGAIGCGLQIIRTKASFSRIFSAGIAVGLGVAAMHYIGMASMRFGGSVAYTPGLWGLSVLVGIAAATAALWMSITVQDKWRRGVAASVMGGAICGMHYVGMASTVFRVDPLAQVVPGLPSGPIAIALTLATLALILCALVFVAADRRILASAQHEAEQLRRSNAQLAIANIELELGRQQFDAALSNMSQGLTFFDCDEKLIVCNRRYGEIYGLSQDQIRPGTTLPDIINHRMARGSLPDLSRAEYLARCEKLSLSAGPYDITDQLRDGRIISMHHQPLPNGGWVTTHEDITERRQAEASIAFMAQHDALTRLANRVLFNDRLEQAIAMAGRGSEFAVICLDLDHFKTVNDTLGHAVGDGLLQAVADRLRACVRQGDTVARLGGDEFAIIQLPVAQPDHAELLTGRIMDVFQHPIDVEGHLIMTGLSVGVALAPGDGATPERLLRNADIALYLAKTEGRGTVRFFEPEMDARIQLRRTLELDLRVALIRNEFEIYYQPLISLAAGKITGFEALLRWHHPVRGLVSPAEFIPVAEETGMIVAIGAWVLRTACFEAESWPANISLAVNLSSVQFKKGDLVSTVRAALAASGLRPQRLELEITESVLLHDSVAIVSALHQLRAMGIAVALDDFGTGYSSLSYLRSFPFDRIKIDQSFVRDLVSNKESMSIIRAVTGLGHSLSMKTTAEGVETEEQLDKLREEGCTEVQGYLFSRPRPAGELPMLIEQLQQISEGAGR
jgi:diguanylate cyclase (GGDEF)-like protein